MKRDVGIWYLYMGYLQFILEEILASRGVAEIQSAAEQMLYQLFVFFTLSNPLNLKARNSTCFAKQESAMEQA